MFALIPYGYLAILLPVAVHEVVGHGLVALAVGGRFLGFQIGFDGMGYAIVPTPGEAGGWRALVVLMGGVTATTTLGLAMLLLTWLARRRPGIALPLLILSFGLLAEGPAYMFWNAWQPVPPGDIGRVLLLTGSASLRVGLMVVGGIAMVGSVVTFTLLLFALLESWVTAGGRLAARTRALLLIPLGAIPGAAWFVFDWDVLVPGVGVLPNVVGLLLHLASAALLLLLHPRVPRPVGRSGLVAAAVIGWALAGASITAIALWLEKGVFFL